MKEYLIQKRPRFTIKLLIAFLISTLIISLAGMLWNYNINELFLLHPSNLSQPLSWYKFFTYPFYANGLKDWFIIASILLPAGYIIENRTSSKNIVSILLISTLLGGFLYTFTNQSDELDRAVGSPGLIAWGFWIATIICGLINWKNLNIVEKAIVVLFILSSVSFGHSDFGYLVATIGVIIAILIFVLTFKIFKKQTVANT